MFLPWGLALSIALGAAGAQAPLAVELGPQLPCDVSAHLIAALAEKGIAIEPGSTVVLTVRADGPSLVLRLTRASEVIGARRLTPSPSDCPVLSQVAALLVASWLDDPEEAPAAGPAPAPKPVAPRPRPSAAPVRTEPELVTPPIESDPEPQTEPIAPRLPRPPDYFVALPVHLPPSTPIVQSVSIALTGGAGLGITDSPVAFARLWFEWGLYEPWAISLDAGVDSDRTQGTSFALARANLEWLTLSGRFALATTEHHGLYASLGGQLLRFDASSRGFSDDSSASFLAAGAQLGFEWRWTLVGGLFVVSRLTAQLREPQTFNIAGYGPILTIPGFTARLEFGLGWKFL